MKNLSNNRETQQRAKDVSSSGVEAGFKVQSAFGIESLELIQSCSSDCGCDTGVATRALSSTDHSAVINSHAANLIGVNSSAVVAAEGLSGKGMYFGSSNAMNYIHREASIDILHLVPTDGEALQGINNHQAFISENNFGMNENKVEDAANYQSPRQGAKGTYQSVINNVYVNQSANCEESAESHDVSATGSKALGVGKAVTHFAIISRQEIVTERRAA